MTYEQIHEVQKHFVPMIPYQTKDGWMRSAKSDRYFLDYNPKTADQRIVDGKTEKVEWQYYRDFYNGN